MSSLCDLPSFLLSHIASLLSDPLDAVSFAVCCKCTRAALWSSPISLSFLDDPLLHDQLWVTRIKSTARCQTDSSNPGSHPCPRTISRRPMTPHDNRWCSLVTTRLPSLAPELRRLSLAGCNVKDSDVRRCLEGLPRLETLILDNCQKITSSLAPALAACSSLRTLSLLRCFTLSAAVLLPLLSSPSLRCLLLSHLHRLTAEHVAPPNGSHRQPAKENTSPVPHSDRGGLSNHTPQNDNAHSSDVAPEPGTVLPGGCSECAAPGSTAPGLRCPAACGLRARLQALKVAEAEAAAEAEAEGAGGSEQRRGGSERKSSVPRTGQCGGECGEECAGECGAKWGGRCSEECGGKRAGMKDGEIGEACQECVRQRSAGGMGPGPAEGTLSPASLHRFGACDADGGRGLLSEAAAAVVGAAAPVQRSPLRLLALHGCQEMAAEALLAVVRLCPSLEALFLGSTSFAPQQHLAPHHQCPAAVVPLLPELRILELSFAAPEEVEAARRCCPPSLALLDLSLASGAAAAASLSACLAAGPSKDPLDVPPSPPPHNGIERRRDSHPYSTSPLAAPRSPLSHPDVSAPLLWCLRACVACTGPGSHTPLHLAAMQGEAGRVQHLLDVLVTADRLLRGNKDRPLHKGLDGDGWEEGEKGAMPEEVVSDEGGGFSRRGGAVSAEVRAVVNLRDGRACTALFYAAFGGHTEVAKELLAAGADVTVPNRAYELTLYIAALRGHSETLQLLLWHCDAMGIDWTHPDMHKRGEGWSPLMAAAVADRTDILQLLLSQRRQLPPQFLDMKNRYGFTALHIAARRGCVDFVRALLDAGADAMVRDTYDWTAYDEAQEHGHREVCEVLAACGGKPKQRQSRKAKRRK